MTKQTTPAVPVRGNRLRKTAKVAIVAGVSSIVAGSYQAQAALTDAVAFDGTALTFDPTALTGALVPILVSAFGAGLTLWLLFKGIKALKRFIR